MGVSVDLCCALFDVYVWRCTARNIFYAEIAAQTVPIFVCCRKLNVKFILRVAYLSWFSLGAFCVKKQVKNWKVVPILGLQQGSRTKSALSSFCLIPAQGEQIFMTSPLNNNFVMNFTTRRRRHN